MKLKVLGALYGLLLCVSSAAAATGAGAGQQLLSAEDEAAISARAETHTYQSDITRLMKTVVHSLYHDREVFIRELLSNANDAIEKTRIMSLTDPSILDTNPSLNVSILVDKPSKRLVIRDSGIGMSKDSLTSNLGTIARSGTTEFLEKLDKGEGDNLIGQFGLGFYSSFLVADKVTVASKSNEDPVQHIFESQAEAAGYSIAEDPRGDTLGRGTEITLWLRDDAAEFLDNEKITALAQKHSQYGTAPIYIWTEQAASEKKATSSNEGEDDEVKVEEEEEPTVESTWVRVNERAPIWMREPKDISQEEYDDFFKATFKETEAPLAHAHFKGDADSTTFRALIYLPSAMPHDFYSKDYVGLESLKLFVRRVLITNDLGENFLPKYLNWIKVFVDADDLPLNVGRDSLQKSRALVQIKRNLVKRALDLFANLAKNEPEKYAALYQKSGVALKLGAIEDTKNRARIVKLLRFETSHSDTPSSLDDIVSRRKKGQTQIFFVAGAGLKKAQLEKSPFVEKLIARGYEVVYFGEPMDEMLAASIGSYEGLKFQDVAKKGLEYGDEDEEDETTKEELAELTKQFEPLSTYLKRELGDHINDVVLSTRLTNSPCLIVTDSYAWTGNMERLMAAQNSGTGDNFMANFMRTQKRTFEINPRHPLIEGLLEKVELSEGDADAEQDLAETVGVLYETAMIRSGFMLQDTDTYFRRVEHLLRKSLGVSTTAEAKLGEHDVRPAPPVDPVRVSDAFDGEANVPVFDQPDEWANWADMKEGLRKAGVDPKGNPVPPVAAGADAVEDDSYVHHDEL